ncbi:hypothetical protein CIB48_g1469 [Xylaria polymorpha]|nr:hypothetical protein CIB48_g1469 [Xylaria polymorpha]
MWYNVVSRWAAHDQECRLSSHAAKTGSGSVGWDSSVGEKGTTHTQVGRWGRYYKYSVVISEMPKTEVLDAQFHAANSGFVIGRCCELVVMTIDRPPRVRWGECQDDLDHPNMEAPKSTLKDDCDHLAGGFMQVCYDIAAVDSGDVQPESGEILRGIVNGAHKFIVRAMPIAQVFHHRLQHTHVYGAGPIYATGSCSVAGMVNRPAGKGAREKATGYSKRFKVKVTGHIGRLILKMHQSGPGTSLLLAKKKLEVPAI